MKKLFFFILALSVSCHMMAEDGYDLWLRYKPVNTNQHPSYKKIRGAVVRGNSATILAAKSEISRGLSRMLVTAIPFINNVAEGSLLIGNAATLKSMNTGLEGDYRKISDEGYIIKTTTVSGKNVFIITGNTDAGVLYGVFHFLRLVQTGQPVSSLDIISSPKCKLRLLNHWDNLDRHVERGYAGISIWNWHTLPAYKDPRYTDYARANASIGINGTVLTNVNANAFILTLPYLEKVKALADIFRPYGIKVYLTARFSAPIEIGKLRTADPLNDTVRKWWQEKAKEIYKLIPDFGGFLVKANSEGQPGPQNYNRTHVDGANMLAEAVKPFGGIVMWRAFVYGAHSPDRFKQAYEEFKPFDGQFLNNILVQVKNGPIDFQPREPFSPLFGAMKQTPLMMEFQLTQEYLGQGTHLVYQAPLYKEVLEADTWADGKGSTVAKVVDGSLDGHALNGMAGVSNIGNDRNWTGHIFGQANWYTFGRLAWDHTLSAEVIAVEWLRQTFTADKSFIDAAKSIMMASHETMVNYMTPLGLHHIMGNGHHYGPAPWSDNLPRPDWNPVYYHKADSIGIGFDRTATGSNALSQYHPEVRKQFENLATCDEKYLLWFHHVNWDHTMKSGRTLWEELCSKYYTGVNDVTAIRTKWNSLEKFVDKERFDHVRMLLDIQVNEATWWRDACIHYFQSFSKKEIPTGFEKPAHTLDYYKQLRFPYAPGN